MLVLRILMARDLQLSTLGHWRRAIRNSSFLGIKDLIYITQILDTFDLAAPILKAAVKCEQIHIRGTTNTLLSQDFSLLQRYIKFPFPALIPQEDVELFALNSLGSSGVALFRNKRVVGFDLGSKSRISVLFEDGSKIQPKYIVGADGAHSMVRKFFL